MLSERAAALSLMPAGTLSLMQQPFHSDNCFILFAATVFNFYRLPRQLTACSVMNYQQIPCAIIASATFWKPTMLAPATRL